MSYAKAMKHHRNLRKCRKQGRMYKGFDCCSGPTPSFWSSPLLAAMENIRRWFPDRNDGDSAQRQYARECIREQVADYRLAYASMLASKAAVSSLNQDNAKLPFTDFNQAYRYSVPVETELILSLPVTDFRPDAMRVTSRKSALSIWFEVESFCAARNKWIDQKSHPTEAAAIDDAKGWYPQPGS